MSAIDGGDADPTPAPVAPPEQTVTEPPVQPEPEPPATNQSNSFAEPFNGPNLTAYTKDGYAKPQVRQDLAQIASLGSTAVALIPTWYMKGPDSNRITPDPAKTPSDASLRQAFEWAGQQGLEVVLKPHIDVLDESFRGDIQPARPGAWFGSYERFISHYAKLASDSGAALFVVGTELKSMSADTEPWRSVIDAVRGQYYGPLTYAANWDEVSQVQFWDELDLIGVDAYYPLAAEGEVPTAESLAAAWQPNVDALKSLSDQWGVPVLITEFGYPTQASAASNPFGVQRGEPADQAAPGAGLPGRLRRFLRRGLGQRHHVVELASRPRRRRRTPPPTTRPKARCREQIVGSAQAESAWRPSAGSPALRLPLPNAIPQRGPRGRASAESTPLPCLFRPALTGEPLRCEPRSSQKASGHGRRRSARGRGVLAALAVCVPVLVTGPARRCHPAAAYDRGQQQLQEIAGSVDELKSQVAADNRRVDDLLGELSGLRATADALTAELESKQAELDRLEADLKREKRAPRRKSGRASSGHSMCFATNSSLSIWRYPGRCRHGARSFADWTNLVSGTGYAESIQNRDESVIRRVTGLREQISGRRGADGGTGESSFRRHETRSPTEQQAAVAARDAVEAQRAEFLATRDTRQARIARCRTRPARSKATCPTSRSTRQAALPRSRAGTELGPDRGARFGRSGCRAGRCPAGGQGRDRRRQLDRRHALRLGRRSRLLRIFRLRLLRRGQLRPPRRRPDLPARSTRPVSPPGASRAKATGSPFTATRATPTR